MDNLLIIDGNALVYQSFYALKKIKNGGLFGAIKKTIMLMKSNNYFNVVFAFDKSKKTFRNKIDNSYKKDRKTPGILIKQLNLFKNFLISAGINYIELDNFEADDLIGSFAKKYANKFNVYIWTIDNDLFQLLTIKNVFVLMRSKKEKKIITYDKEKVFKDFGYYPKHLVDIKSLSGDKSDNISGIKGISFKCANLLLTIFNDLDNIYLNINFVPQKLNKYLFENGIKYRLNTIKVQDLLLKNKNLAYKCKKLAKIITSLDVDLNFKKLEINSKKANLFLRENKINSITF